METFRSLLKQEFLPITHTIFRNSKLVSDKIYARGYFFRANIEDIRTGGRCTNKIIPTRYKDAGANGMQNSDYRCLDQIFGAVPLRNDDVYVDVGCGEGRTLTYHFARGFRGPAYGVELDPIYAEVAAHRTRKCETVKIVNDNILEQNEIVASATAFFLFNSFNKDVLVQFLDMIERAHATELDFKDGVRLYYFCDYLRSELEQRKGWIILWRGMTVRKPWKDLPATIYEFRPNDCL